MIARSAALLALICTLAPSSLLVSADMTPEQVARCKHATGLIRVGDSAEGTAFHIGDGLFLTNQHVIAEGEKGDVLKIVLDPGEKSQRIIPLTVVRQDPKADLALLKTAAKELPPALSLGDSSALVETAPVAIFGYPFGSELAIKEGDYPSISVSACRVSSFRKKEGKVIRIQVDASVNPGNSGGPLINGSGQVVGIVDSTIEGSGLSFAIPADAIGKFLHGPAIMLRAAALKMEPGAESVFSVDVSGVSQQGPDLSVSLRLSTHAQDHREYKTTASGGAYSVSAPVVPQLGADILTADVEERDTQWTLWVKDRLVDVGGRKVRLSSIKEITLGAAPMVCLTNGSKLPASVSGLNGVEPAQGTMKVDLSRAVRISFSAAKLSVKEAKYEVVVRKGAEIVASQKGTIASDGVHPEVLMAEQKLPEPKAEEPRGVPLPADIPCYRCTATGHDYCLIELDHAIRWTEALEVAQTLRYKGRRGHLVTITSRGEGGFVSQILSGRKGSYWIGAYQDRSAPDYREPDGGWRWVTGERWALTNWRSGEPNNQGDEDVINTNQDGKWNDISPTQGADGFIVEFE